MKSATNNHFNEVVTTKRSSPMGGCAYGIPLNAKNGFPFGKAFSTPTIRPCDTSSWTFFCMAFDALD